MGRAGGGLLPVIWLLPALAAAKGGLSFWLARKQFNELLVYYAPESYPEASTLWYSLAGRIEESQVSSVFYPQALTMKDNRIEVFGDLKQYTGNTRLENTTRTYFLDFQIRDGRFSLLAFKEKEKSGEERSDK